MIDKLNTHYSFTTPASVHDEEALTALELAGRQGKKINEIIDDQNDLRNVTMPREVRNVVNSHIENGDFDEQINESLGNMRQRLDNLIAQTPNAPTTMDAEIIDVRLGLDGSVFSTAGGAVRGQFGEWGRAIATQPIGAKLVFLQMVSGEYYSNTNGAIGFSDEWKRSNFMLPCKEGVLFRCAQHNNDSMFLVCYDAEMKHIGHAHITNDDCKGHNFGVTPTGTCFVGLSVKATNTASEFVLEPVYGELSRIEYPFTDHRDKYIKYTGCFYNNAGNASYSDDWNCFIIPADGVTRIYSDAKVEHHGICFDHNNNLIGPLNKEQHTVGTSLYPLPGTKTIILNGSATQYHYGNQAHLSAYFQIFRQTSAGPLNNRQILAFGDSITWYDGQFAGDGQPMRGWQHELRRAGAIVNAWGLSGGSIAYEEGVTVSGSVYDTVMALQSGGHLNIADFDTCIIFAGTNDIYYGAAEAKTRAYLSAMIEYIYSINPMIDLYVCNVMIARAPRTVENITAMNNLIQEVCGVYNVPVIDLYHQTKFNTYNFAHYFHDGVHPNSRGHAHLGEVIKNAIVYHHTI